MRSERWSKERRYGISRRYSKRISRLRLRSRQVHNRRLCSRFSFFFWEGKVVPAYNDLTRLCYEDNDPSSRGRSITAPVGDVVPFTYINVNFSSAISSNDVVANFGREFICVIIKPVSIDCSGIWCCCSQASVEMGIAAIHTSKFSSLSTHRANTYCNKGSSVFSPCTASWSPGDNRIRTARVEQPGDPAQT